MNFAGQLSKPHANRVPFNESKKSLLQAMKFRQSQCRMQEYILDFKLFAKDVELNYLALTNCFGQWINEEKEMICEQKAPQEIWKGFSNIM